MQAQWSVWKHSGFKDKPWICVVQDTDEGYARHVYKYILENQMKEGVLQLRLGDEVLEEEQLLRQRKNKVTDDVETIEQPVLADLREISQLARINPVLGEIYREYESGKFGHTTMLERAVRKLADFDNIMPYIEDQFWNSPNYYEKFPTEKLTTRNISSLKLTKLLSITENNLKEAQECLSELGPHPAYMLVIRRISADLKACIEMFHDGQYREYR
ncbi:hypothetical protein AV654_19415 [Paenibacillus elgii]|uniref:Uncharacterized protein n=1 Tax=Paenibacillus elgii TaxID=189691 RepID=A0A163XMV5_9BACL|nr:hypothetical protein [Paenibacillus elgii]KZE78146.1 hypothetical protein AV654_19415 [Paenibacillus elgii]